jgi:hypothetical protein
MPTTADHDSALSAIAVRTILDLPTSEILRLVVGLGDTNTTELLGSLIAADRQLLAAHLRARIVKEAGR